MLLDVLPQKFLVALVIALNNFEKAAFIVRSLVFEHYDGSATLIWASNLAEHAALLMLVHVFPSKLLTATLFK